MIALRDPGLHSALSNTSPAQIKLDALTENCAVFKMAPNTLDKMWRRLSVALGLGVKFLEDKLLDIYDLYKAAQF